MARKLRGRLSWHAGTPVRVQAVTDNAPRFEFGEPGKLIPHESHITVVAPTLGGWDLTTFPARGNATIHSDSPHVTWDFPTHGLELSRKTEATNRTLAGLTAQVQRAALQVVSGTGSSSMGKGNSARLNPFRR